MKEHGVITSPDPRSVVEAINRGLCSSEQGYHKFHCHSTFTSLEDVVQADSSTHDSVAICSSFTRPDLIRISATLRSSDRLVEVREVRSAEGGGLQLSRYTGTDMEPSSGDEWQTVEAKAEMLFTQAFLLGFVTAPFVLTGTKEEAFGFPECEYVRLADLEWIKCFKRDFRAEQSLYLRPDPSKPFAVFLHELRPRDGKAVFLKYSFDEWHTSACGEAQTFEND